MAAGKSVLYFNFISQPSRAVVLFIRFNQLPVDEKQVLLHKKQQRTPEFLAINPLGKVPALQDEDGFCLPESCAILRYLAAKYRVPDHWYPGDARLCARVDAALDWHHMTIRRGCTAQIWNRILAPMSGQPSSKEQARDGESTLRKALQDLEEFWLGSTPYVGGEHISLGDLPILTELETLRLLDGAAEGPTMEQQLADFAKVRAWMARVRAELEPHYSSVHATLDKAVQNAVRRKQQQQQGAQAKL